MAMTTSSSTNVKPCFFDVRIMTRWEERVRMLAEWRMTEGLDALAGANQSKAWMSASIYS